MLFHHADHGLSNYLIDDEASFLYQSAFLCREGRSGYDGAWQIAPFQCSIPFASDCIVRLQGLKNHLASIFPDLIAFGERRAKKAFVDVVDTVTKTSYIKRIRNFLDSGTDRFSTLVDICSREPASGGLVFSVFSPVDLENRQRPGYVPCLVSGSFLLHEGKLHLNAFFRSQSVVEFGIFDLLFLRQFQIDFVDGFNRRSEKRASPGPLNLQFARILIHRRLLKSDKKFVRRAALVDRWIGEVEQYMLISRGGCAEFND